MIGRILAALSLAALMLNGAAAASAPNICAAPNAVSLAPAAQSSTCMSPDALLAARSACTDMESGQICLGAGTVTTNPTSGLIVPGASVDLGAIDSLHGADGALAVLTMQADLPDADKPIRLVLYGNSTMTSAVTALAEPYPTATVKNGPANILNLRAAPNDKADVVTTMKWSEELTADGRNSDGSWLRVQTAKGMAWVFASLVKVTVGDASALYVLDSPVTKHMQGFTLTSAGGSCDSGLVVQAANRETAHIQVNGALLSFSTATLLLQAEQNQPLMVRVIGGIASISANGQTVEAEAGSLATVAADAAPILSDHYAFASLASVPLDSLPQEALTCVVGVNSSTAALYSTPGASQSSGSLSADGNATVTGKKTVAGVTWYLVDGGQWVKAGDVQTAGYCAALPEASTQVSQPAQTSSFARDQVPAGRSIWQAHTGVDHQSGVCTAPPIAQCDHLAAVTTQPDGTITWLGQEPAPYTLRPSGANTFSFSGRNQLNNANLSLTVTFTGPTNWVGTMKLVYDSDAGCTHQFNYTADRIR